MENHLVYLIEYSRTDKTKEIIFTISNEGISMYKINKLINGNESHKILRLYNFNGVEITDESDLDFCRNNSEKNKIIFFSNRNLTFDKQEILRLFKIENKIGEGGFSSVYLASQRFTKDLYAIKYLNSMMEEKIRNDFIFKELEALRRLNHPHIIKLYNYCLLSDNSIAFILEYLPKGNLRNYMKIEKKLEEQQAREIFTQIAKAVNFFHSHGILHLDLKPENILLDENQIKIIDFGLASLKSNEKSLGGSLHYMPPEIIFQLNDISIPQNDVWSIGIILYELVLGGFPFDGDLKQVKKQLKSLKIKNIQNLSFELQDLIKKILTFDFKERIKMNQILNHPWIKGETIEIIEIKTKSISPNLKNKNKNKKKEVHRETRSNSLEDELNKYNKIKIVMQNNTQLNNQNYSTEGNKDKLEKTKIMKPSTKTSNLLPKIQTKLNTNLNENAVCDLNIELLKNGAHEIPTYLKPIGHSKQLKQKLGKIKEFFHNLNEMKDKFDHDEGEIEKLKMRRKSSADVVSKFNTQNQKISLKLTITRDEEIKNQERKQVKPKKEKNQHLAISLHKQIENDLSVSPENFMRKDKNKLFQTMKVMKFDDKKIFSKSMKSDIEDALKNGKNKNMKTTLEHHNLTHR